jgi:ADP-ribosyl-[dinitrogen reductase] hydrolase
MTTSERDSRAIGMVVGAAVGDALGAPFEFKSRGLYRTMFPAPVLDGLGEMIGGGYLGWEPGEFTDDTQMALALAESILEAGTFDPETTWRWFTTWAMTAPDVGSTTSSSLSHSDWRMVQTDLHASPSNGALMRSFVQAAAFIHRPRDVVQDIVLRQSALTHPHPVSGWGAWICVEMCRTFIGGSDAFAVLDELIAATPDDYRTRFAELLSPDWSPDRPHESNGSARGCLAQAVWAVRSTESYEDAVIAAVNLGDDADTVGCVAGALAGARYGVESVPKRWRWAVHGRFDGPDGLCEYSVADLEEITRSLLALDSTPG